MKCGLLYNIFKLGFIRKITIKQHRFAYVHYGTVYGLKINKRLGLNLFFKQKSKKARHVPWCPGK
jgi:hypothetical protein